MKTSNKLFSCAALLLVGMLITYNFLLSKEYNKGTFRDPWRYYNSITTKPFDKIEIKAAHYADVRIIKSKDYKVRVNFMNVNEVKYKMNGNVLEIQIKETKYMFDSRIAVFCPDIKALQANSTFRKKTDFYRNDETPLDISLEDFTLNQLQIEEGTGTGVKLENNQINHLKAEIGGRADEISKLEINENNTVGSGVFNIKNKSHLILNTTVSQLKYDLDDRAKITLNGTLLKSIQQDKQ